MEEIIVTAPTMLETLPPIGDWVIVLPIVLALMGAAVSLVLRRRPGLAFVGAALVVIAIIATEIALVMKVMAAGPVSMTMGKWLPPFGISLTVDAFGAIFALAAAVVTLIVLVYAEIDREEADSRNGFHALVLLLLTGVTGAFLTGDLFNLYVWFEVMLIASFGLIIQGGKDVQLDGAVKYGFLNFLATVFFLLSLGLLYGLVGTLNMADIMRAAPSADPAAIAAIASMLILAFGMKAAAFPLNSWLPASYHTPPAVISALFAGLLTKVGAYALLRSLVAILPESRDLLEPVLVIIAIATLVIAPLGAIAETNLRRAIGFVVIGGIGAVIAGIAMASETGIAGSGLYIVHAIVTMTALYLTAGLVEKMTGATDTRQMGGLYGASTPISILFFVLIMGAAGVPPFLGFWPKLLLLQGGFEGADWVDLALAIALLVNAVLTIIAGSRLWAHVFWRGAADGVEAPKDNGRLKLGFGATGLLTAAIIVVGLWPGPLMGAIKEGAGDILDPARYVAATNLAGGAR
ncbi:MAG: Na+/H+ antiporter subunit D [Phyllobacteriaceae bacterium]|nr:Na+/H+ antiporter subunit D [Phyllobacteriaceae bacterium]